MDDGLGLDIDLFLVRFLDRLRLSDDDELLELLELLLLLLDDEDDDDEERRRLFLDLRDEERCRFEEDLCLRPLLPRL